MFFYAKPDNAPQGHISPFFKLHSHSTDKGVRRFSSLVFICIVRFRSQIDTRCHAQSQAMQKGARLHVIFCENTPTPNPGNQQLRATPSFQRRDTCTQNTSEEATVVALVPCGPAMGPCVHLQHILPNELEIAQRKKMLDVYYDVHNPGKEKTFLGDRSVKHNCLL